jgi:glycosyltransferase involved in cell wall biosynthesis
MTISVVIPAYNGARYIEQAILSVLAQERRPDEILVYNDGSTDETLAICRRYAGEVLVYSSGGGPSGFVNGWNKAISRATGDFISILHQDDLLFPEFIRMGMEVLEREADVRHLFAACRYISQAGRELGVSFSARFRTVRYTGLEYVRAYQDQGDPHIHRCPGVITHRSIFEECRYESRAGHIADDDFFYRVGMYTDVIGLLRPLAAYRVHEESVTGKMEDAALAGKLMEDYFYQCRQWKGNAFLDKEAYDYFVYNAYRYIRRTIGYGFKQGKFGMIVKAVALARKMLRLSS